MKSTVEMSTAIAAQVSTAMAVEVVEITEVVEAREPRELTAAIERLRATNVAVAPPIRGYAHDASNITNTTDVRKLNPRIPGNGQPA